MIRKAPLYPYGKKLCVQTANNFKILERGGVALQGYIRAPGPCKPSMWRVALPSQGVLTGGGVAKATW